MNNNHLINTPVMHMDEFDLEALKNWKATLLGFPRILQSTKLIGIITDRIATVEADIEGRNNAN